MTRSTFRISLALLLSATLAAAAHAADDHASWGYHGEHDATHWGDIAPEFATCKLGRNQSPIDIRTGEVKRARLERIEFNYSPSVLNLVNNGHTIQANYDAGSFIRIGNRRYDLLQFHFHTPSEEEVDGKEFDLVAHLVHRSTDGELAVVAVLFERGAENTALNKFWGKLPTAAGESRTLAKTKINAADLLPAEQGYYTFPGSLTTPPCSEKVRWLVLKTPVPVSKAQVTGFRRIYPMNNRPVQPLNGRVVQATLD